MAKKAKPVVDERLQQWEEFAAANSALYALIDAEGNLVGDKAYDFIREPKNGFAVFKKDGKYGFLRLDGSEAVDPIYESVSDFDGGLAAVRVDGHWGFINEKGEVVIAPQYENYSSPYFREGLAYVQKNGKYGFIDMEGNEVIEPAFEDASSFNDGLAKVKVDGRFGFIDKAGKMVIDPAYDKVKFDALAGGEWRGGFAIVTVANKTGIIDRTGKVILPLEYDDVFLSTSMVTARRTDGENTYYKFSVKPKGDGLLREDGVVILEPVYDEIGKYSEGLVAVSRDGKCGYFDTEGREVLPLEYDRAASFLGNFANVTKDKQSCVIDKTGRVICDRIGMLQYGVIENIDGYFLAIKDEKYGLIDEGGKFIMPCEFDEIKRWGITNFVQVKKDDKYGIYDLAGKEVVKIEYDSIDTPHAQGVPVRITLEWYVKEGAISTDGQIILDPNDFSSCYVDEKGGVIIVKNGEGKYGLRRFDGSEITPCIFDSVGYFSTNGTAVAKVNGREGLINREGQWIIPAEYEDIYEPSKELIGAKKDGKWGFINAQNEWVIAPVYDGIQLGFVQGYAIVRNEDYKYILINSTGKELTKPVSDLQVYNPAEGLIRYKVGRKYGYLDTAGAIAIKPAFDEADDFKNECALVSIKVEKQPMWTFVTKDGVTHETFEGRVFNLGQLIPVEKDGKKAFFRPTGTLAVPFVLKQVSRKLDGVSVIQFV
ncbi:MAG: WG repeat-containing protein [Muribaculaceae bacterium]|nr:WG repeat-containing protein [Muribaculaceae bacterium]